MEEEDPNYTVVEYLDGDDGHSCGYCKSSDSNYNKGMWAHRMAVGHYQELIDRGWRRSGKYCYKPTMDKMCCPSYAIRCDAVSFKLSKSQKKVLKRMHNYLSYGTSSKSSDQEKVDSMHVAEAEPVKEEIKEVTPKASPNVNCDSIQETISKLKEPTSSQKGLDPSKPPCKKAKLIRREKYAAKEASQNAQPASAKKETKAKSLEDYLNASLPQNPAHKLELHLIQSQPPSKEFNDTFPASHTVYKRYQMTIHQDPPNKPSPQQYSRFLCQSPLQKWSPESGPDKGFGSYHQQYWLDDDRLIGVGVIDILPNCVSSVYFYYDPEFSFLSLGTYASLREIALTRELCNSVPSIHWYYMGYYIHSCPKMRYKGAYYPSYLLCPETYRWVEIEKCRSKLDQSKYSRLIEDDTAIDSNELVNIKKTLCLCGGSPMLYETYKGLFRCRPSDEEEVLEYSSLVGASLCSSMLLYRN